MTIRVEMYPNGTWGIQGEVGPVDDDGKLAFGASTTIAVRRDYGGGPFEATVQVGGIMAHDTEVGRLRARSFLIACDIADALEHRLNEALSFGDFDQTLRPELTQEGWDRHVWEVLEDYAEKYHNTAYRDDGVRLF